MNYRMLAKLDGDSLTLHRVVKHELADSPLVNRNDQQTALGELQYMELSTKELLEALESLGMPRDHLATLRAAHTEDELIDALEQIPQHWSETALCLFEMSDIQIPRARFQVLADDSELERMLNEPAASWQLYLHPAQRHIATLPWDYRVAVSGSAGTGKTVCAWYRMQHVALESRRVAFVCPNEAIFQLSEPVLAELLKESVGDAFFLMPRSADEMRQLAQQVDHIVVDEGQELSPQWYSSLSSATQGRNLGLTLFFDLNQLFGNIPRGDGRRYENRLDRWSKAMAQLRCTSMTLYVNYRNSREIAQCYFRLLDEALPKRIICELPAFSAGDVVRIGVRFESDLAIKLAEIYRRLRKDYVDSDIAIVCLLSEKRIDELAIELQKKGVSVHRELSRKDGVIITAPDHIRGYERKVVIAILPSNDSLVKNPGSAIRGYVGLSRARERLIIVEPKEDR
jgi:hypothetical protein